MNPTEGMTEPPKQWWQIRKIQVIVGVLLLFALLFIGFLILANGKKEAGDGTVYHDRPGYDRTKLTSAIGDPMALSPVANTTAAMYKDTKVIQACNLLPIEEISKQDLRVRASSLPTSITRTYFDGQSQTALALDELSLPRDLNTCTYYLNGSGDVSDIVTIDVYQPMYAASSAVEREISRRFTATTPLNGIAVYTRTAADNATYSILRSGTTSAQLLVNIREGDKQAKTQKVLAAVANGLARESQHPEGAWKTAYNSPVFKKSSFAACELFTAQDVIPILGDQINPVVKEGIATATSVTKFTAEGASYSSIASQCRRSAAAQGRTTATQTITVDAQTFQSDTAAQESFASTRTMATKTTNLPSKVGDEAVFAERSGSREGIIARQGRLVIEVSYDSARGTFSAQQQIEALTPLAGTILSRVHNQ